MHAAVACANRFCWRPYRLYAGSTIATTMMATAMTFVSSQIGVGQAEESEGTPQDRAWTRAEIPTYFPFAAFHVPLSTPADLSVRVVSYCPRNAVPFHSPLMCDRRLVPCTSKS